jgi:hypothetical protein
MSTKDSQRRPERIGITASAHVAKGQENPPQVKEVLTYIQVDL